MAQHAPILVTGAGGGVGGMVIRFLREQDRPVRAMVHHDDERAAPLRALGAEVVAGDLTNPADVARVLDGCPRVYFGMSVAASYLEAAATVASVARAAGGLEVLVSISQMTVSQMTPTSTEESRHQRLHFLAEQILDWSGLPVVHVRPTIFLENPLLTMLSARSVAEHGVLRLPFGTGRTSPVGAVDVARVVTALLEDPAPHVGETYELTGPRVLDMAGLAEEYSRGLGRPVTHLDVPFDDWAAEVAQLGLPPHVEQHLLTMARLHRQDRYDRATDTVQTITGKPAQSVAEFVALHADLFT
ncbi:MAG TPA: NAD(P)H-binding protein [Acidimicrobiia bacterium]|jgi:uncharacterized protein YbjT (DUF2867 family)|nr:NAD(P)H-binding protein [Acidimicrobiia bacterium]